MPPRFATSLPLFKFRCCFIIYIIGTDPSQENIDYSRLVASCLKQIRLDFQGAEKRSLFPDE